MAKEFNVKDFLQKNKVGPYGLIKENYTDLRPVGAGNIFGGYTQALREDLEEDDTYLGPKKPEPHQIYAQDDEYGDEDNAWMEDVHNEIVGDWQVDYDGNPGVLIWTCYNDSSFYAVATPKWDNQPGTPIEIVKVEEDGYIGDDVHMLYTEKQDEFVSFEEYAETIEPILEKYLQAKKRGEVDENLEEEEGLNEIGGWGDAKDNPKLQAAAKYLVQNRDRYVTPNYFTRQGIDLLSAKSDRELYDYVINNMHSDEVYDTVADMKSQIEEDINNGPVGNDKLEEFEDDDIEGTERMQGIISREDMKNFIHFASRIFKDLLDDGFEPEDIEDFLVKEIRSIIG